MKNLTAIAAGTLALSIAATAAPAQDSREYHRGYYDCLAGRYDPEAHSHAYRQGCRAAEREQERGPGGPGGEPPPPGWGHNGAAPGWGGGPAGAQPVGIPNVKGMEPAQVLNAMAALGYRNVGTQVAGAAVYGFYFNPATGECVQVANMNGRAIGAVPVGSNPRCR